LLLRILCILSSRLKLGPILLKKKYSNFTLDDVTSNCTKI